MSVFAPELDLHFHLFSSSALGEQSVGLNTQSFVNQFLLVSLCLSVYEHTIAISLEQNLYNTYNMCKVLHEDFA